MTGLARPGADAEFGTLTHDAFLGGRVMLWQPKLGYRAATDAVLLAAACPATAGDSVLDLGCGAGAAFLCLAARVPGLTLAGLEAQEGYARLAIRNAAEAGVAAAIHMGDLRAEPAALRALSFDHVIANPPYYAADTLASPRPDRDMARREQAATAADWVDAALRRLKPGGRFAMIHLAERAPDILHGLRGRAGDIRLLPLQGRVGRAAGRVLVRARKGARGPFHIAPPMILHHGPAHASDSDDFTDQAIAVLRDGAPLTL